VAILFSNLSNKVHYTIKGIYCQTYLDKYLTMLLIYKTTHHNGRYYIGRHQTTDLNDGYLGSGVWIRSIKNKNTLSREIIDTADTIEELCKLEEHHIRLHYEDPLCMNIILSSIGMTSEDISGEKHPNYDHDNYHFIHHDGRKFIGTKYNFRKKFDIASGLLSQLFNNNLLSVKGWRFFDSDESYVLLRQNKIHHFVHISGEEFIGNRRDFLKKYTNLKRQYIDFLVSGKSKSAKGWSLFDISTNKLKNKIDSTTYHFQNKDGHVFVGNCYDFRKTHNINQGNLSRMIRKDKKVLSIKGWYLLMNLGEQKCLD
jgi:hypothetical protein